MKENADGTIEFELTDAEAQEADSALEMFKGFVIHPEAAERTRNGTIAVALARYAKDIVDAHCDVDSESEWKKRWREIETTLEKAVAATWKSYSLSPMPIFLYHRACFLKMLGLKGEARRLFGLFVKQQADYRADNLSKLLLTYEGTNIERALSHAKEEG